MAKGLITAGKDALSKAKGAWDFTKGMAQFALLPSGAGGAAPQSMAKITPDLDVYSLNNPFMDWKEKIEKEVWGRTEEMMNKFYPGQYDEPDSKGLRDAIRHFLLTEEVGLPGAMAYEFFVSGGEKSDFINNLEADRLRKQMSFLQALDPAVAKERYGEIAAKMLGKEFMNRGSTELSNVVFPDAAGGNDPTIWDWQDKIREGAFNVGENIQSNIVQPVKEFFSGDEDTPDKPQFPMETLQRNIEKDIQTTRRKVQPPKQYTVEPYLGDRPGRQPKPVDPFAFEDVKARAARPTTPAPSITPVRRRSGGRPTRRGYIPPRGPH